MKTLPIIFATTIITLSLALSSQAQDQRVITLDDGTRITGQVVSFQNGTYTISTENLGELTIKDANVVSISSASAMNNPLDGATLWEGQDIRSAVSQVQASMMNDPNILVGLEELMKDPEIMALLSDQNFINDIMSYDPNRIQANPKAQQLMNNPEMRKLMETMMQKMGAPVNP
jgi:hypothetical protein